MVIAGVVARLTGLASRDALARGMTEVVPAHRADRISRNLAAVKVGYSWVERELPDSFASSRLT
jgi:Pyruvate/2-oxoacid:ferredoxin oxidoreductase gamma subunit